MGNVDFNRRILWRCPPRDLRSPSSELSGRKFDRGSETRPHQERHVNYVSVLHFNRSIIAVSIIVTLLGARSCFKTDLDTSTDSSEIDVTMSDDQTLKRPRGGTCRRSYVILRLSSEISRLEPAPALVVSCPETYESDDNSSMSDVLATKPPSHMLASQTP